MQFFPAFLRDGSGCASPAPAKSRTRGSVAPALLLFASLIVFVAITVYLFATGYYAPPPPITPVGLQVDHQYALTLYATGAIFVLAQLGLGFAVFRFRDRGKPAHFIRGHVGLEITWTLATAAVFLGLGVLGTKAWSATRFQPAAAGAIKVEVTEEQFVYYFRYPGADGKFGRLDPALVSAPTGNPLGIDPDDPAGRDDIVVPTLTVPVNHSVELLIRSQDVIHNFFVRELRLQQDAVPGMIVPLHFTPDRIGRYDIMCTQLCGMGHYQMHSFLNVVSEAEYEKFLAQALKQ